MYCGSSRLARFLVSKAKRERFDRQRFKWLTGLDGEMGTEQNDIAAQQQQQGPKSLVEFYPLASKRFFK